MEINLKNIIQEQLKDIDRNTVVQDFVDFCQQELGYSMPASCDVVDNRNDLTTLASYNLKDNSVKVYGKDRATADILRSVAHELVHHKQLEDGRIDIDNLPKDIGGEIEDEANALAGQLVKKFGYNRREIYENEDRSFCEDPEEGEYFCLAGSENLGATDLFKGDGFDIVHKFGNVYLSDISPEEEETYNEPDKKKIKKTVLKPSLHKGPFNIPVNLSEIKSLKVAQKMIEKQIQYLEECDKMSDHQIPLTEAFQSRWARKDDTITEMDIRVMRQIVREYSPDQIEEMVDQHHNDLSLKPVLKLFGITENYSELLAKQYIQFIWDKGIPTEFEEYVGDSLSPVHEYEISKFYVETDTLLKQGTITVEDTNFQAAICDAETKWWEYDVDSETMEYLDSEYGGEEEWAEVMVDGKVMWRNKDKGYDRKFNNNKKYDPYKSICP